jgi:hypothetical protein
MPRASTRLSPPGVLRAMFVAAALAAGAAHAQSTANLASVGSVDAQSAMQAPLSARVELSLAPGVSAASLRVRVLPSLECGPLGLTCSAFSSQVRARVVGGAGGAVLALSSGAPVRDPNLSVAVELSGPQGRQVLPVALLLDSPPAADAPLSAAQSQTLSAAALASDKEQRRIAEPPPAASGFSWTAVANPALAISNNPPQPETPRAPVLRPPEAASGPIAVASAGASAPQGAVAAPALPAPAGLALPGAATLPQPMAALPAGASPLAQAQPPLGVAPGAPVAGAPAPGALALPPALANGGSPDAGAPQPAAPQAAAPIGAKPAPRAMSSLPPPEPTGFLGLGLLSWAGLVLCFLALAGVLMRSRIQAFFAARGEDGAFTEFTDEAEPSSTPAEPFVGSVSVARGAGEPPTDSAKAAEPEAPRAAPVGVPVTERSGLTEEEIAQLNMALGSDSEPVDPRRPAIDVDPTADELGTADPSTMGLGLAPGLLDRAIARMGNEAGEATTTSVDDPMAELRRALKAAESESDAQGAAAKGSATLEPSLAHDEPIEQPMAQEPSRVSADPLSFEPVSPLELVRAAEEKTRGASPSQGLDLEPLEMPELDASALHAFEGAAPVSPDEDGGLPFAPASHGHGLGDIHAPRGPHGHRDEEPRHERSLSDSLHGSHEAASDAAHDDLPFVPPASAAPQAPAPAAPPAVAPATPAAPAAPVSQTPPAYGEEPIGEWNIGDSSGEPSSGGQAEEEIDWAKLLGEATSKKKPGEEH